MECPEVEAGLWRLYRDFFDQAERRRRWSVRKDIPWEQTNSRLDPAVAGVVESFCAIELYLPDYLGKVLPVVRHSPGRVWFYANWGYEESKHSLALSDWLVRSGHRTEEQMADLDDKVFKFEWNLPHDSHLGMLAYAMVQERATWLNYRNLRNQCIARGGDPALEQLLMFVSVDERAHYAFFQDCVKLFLKYDRAATLEQLRRVMNSFAMPAIHSMADGQEQIARIKSLDIFSEEIYYREIYLPQLAELGVTRDEMRNKSRTRKSVESV
jgi:acyl-[acyl-carrier-protein] desaturase